MSEPGSPAGYSDPKHVMTLYGKTMTRTGGVFAIGMAAIVPFGIVSLAITTRYLEPGDFGRLSLLFAVASVVTVVAGIGFIQGTLMATYGQVDDGDGDVDEVGDLAALDPSAEPPDVTGAERRRLLGSGLLLTVISSSVICTVVGLAGGALTAMAFGDRWFASVCWMAASAFSGANWRMLSQIPRMERRAGRWAFHQFLRPGLVVAASLAALAMGFGVNGVLAATALGTVVACVLAFVQSRHSFTFHPRRADLRLIWDEGSPWIPLTVASVIQSNASILLLAVLATPTSVGLFQVATRISQIPGFFADGFLTGWPTIEMSPLSVAAKEHKGRREYSSSVFTLFSLTTLGVLLAVSLLSDSLIHVAAPSYSSAAQLIPIVAASYGAHAIFRGVYRATSFPLRRYWYTLLHLLWIAPYAAVTALLTPLNASYGVAIGQLAAGFAVSFCFILLDRRGPDPTPFEGRRLGLALAIAVALVVVAEAIPASTELHAALSVGALVAFPVLLVATGVIPRAQIALIRSIVASLVPKLRPRSGVRRQVESLPVEQRQAIVLVAVQRRELDSAARAIGVSAPIVSARVVRGLRKISDCGRPTPIDHLIGEYVVHTGSTLERDAMAVRLLGLGANPLHLHILSDLCSGLRQRRRIPWRIRARSARSGVDQARTDASASAHGGSTPNVSRSTISSPR